MANLNLKLLPLMESLLNVFLIDFFLQDPNFVDLSRRNRFHPVSIDSSLYEVCEALSAPDIHRVPILNEQGKVVTIISQTTIMKVCDWRMWIQLSFHSLTI